MTLEELAAFVQRVLGDPGAVACVLTAMRVGLNSFTVSAYLVHVDGTHEEITP